MALDSTHSASRASRAHVPFMSHVFVWVLSLFPECVHVLCPDLVISLFISILLSFHASVSIKANLCSLRWCFLV